MISFTVNKANKEITINGDVYTMTDDKDIALLIVLNDLSKAITFASKRRK